MHSDCPPGEPGNLVPNVPPGPPRVPPPARTEFRRETFPMAMTRFKPSLSRSSPCRVMCCFPAKPFTLLRGSST